MKRLLLFVLTPLLLLAGCNKQDAITYSGLEAGTIGSGIFLSDYGTRMTVVGNAENYDVTSTRRVLISYETHPVTDPKHIDIDIFGLLDAGILPAESVETLPEAPDGDPLQVTDAWFSAEYLNILVSFAGEDPAKHAFTARYTADEKGIVVRLSHDGSQESAAGNKTLSLFLSVPVSEPALAYEQSALAVGIKKPYPAPVTLQWTARTLEGGPLAVYDRKGSYSPPAND